MNLINSFGKIAGNTKHFWLKNNDKIEFVAGVAAVIAGTVVLIHDAEKIADAKSEVQGKLDYIHDIDKSEEGWAEEETTRGKAITDVAKTAVVEYTKATWKGIGLITAGEVLQGISHATVTQKLTSVSASLAAVSTSFANYRKNVVEDQGIEKDNEYLVGPTMKSVELKKDGTVVETTTPIHTDAINRYIPHSFFFDESNVNWQDSDQANNDFINRVQTFLNQKLSVVRFMTENEIRDFFGAPRTKAGQAAGARYQNLDGTLNQIRVRKLNPDSDKNYLLIIEYSDGKPISDNILDDTDWELC